MSFVLDASVTLAWLLGDERVRQADAVLERLTREGAVVPALWVSEVANGLLSAERRGRIGAKDANLAVELLGELPIEVSPEERNTLGRLRELGAAYALTAYDAAYLDLALARRLPLATLDDELRRAARAAKVGLVASGRSPRA